MSNPEVLDKPIITLDETRNPSGSYLSVYNVNMPDVPYQAQVVARTSGNYMATKALPVFVPEAVLNRSGISLPATKSEVSKQRFMSDLTQIGIDNLSVGLICSQRPIYYFPWPDQVTKWQYEVPGGKIESGDRSPGIAGMRELMEEFGIEDGRIVTYCKAYTRPMAWDAGTHVERYWINFMLCTGRPPSHTGVKDSRLKEGIVAITQQPLRKFVSSLDAAMEDNEAVEGYAYTAAAILESSLKVWPLGPECK